MNPLRIVIIEDEPVTARNLAHILLSIDTNINIVDMLKGVNESIAWFTLNQTNYDLVLMDIRLADGLSFDIFKKVTINKPVVFVTAYHDYAIEAFKNNGIDYILKPFDDQEIKRALDKYNNLVRAYSEESETIKFTKLLEEFKVGIKSYKRSFLVNYRDKLVPLETTKIAWFYTANEIVYGHTADGQQYIMDFTLEQLEEQVDPALFFRANRQFIINRTAIKEIDFYFNGRFSVKINPAPLERVLISKARVPAFKSWMNR